MKILYSEEELIEFETLVADTFNSGSIRAPIHLYYGNESQIIDVFKKINEEDWVLCTWRSHYQCLLKGVPKDELLKAIISGKSIALSFPEYNVFSSAIVGGILPISTGIALDLKRKQSNSKVWCFVGDMTSETGNFAECHKFACNFDLPITYVIENNTLSVCTDTLKTWNMNSLTYGKHGLNKILYYEYKSKYPHAGSGKRIQF